MPRIERRTSVFPSLRLERPPQIRVGRQPKEKLAHPRGLILIDLYLQDDVAWDLCERPQVVHDHGPPFGQRPAYRAGRRTGARVSEVDHAVDRLEEQVEARQINEAGEMDPSLDAEPTDQPVQSSARLVGPNQEELRVRALGREPSEALDDGC